MDYSLLYIIIEENIESGTRSGHRRQYSIKVTKDAETNE